ncbi:hypothetical protein [Agilicoccus flavus]|uniref:hypothetical protein n=1 Tax=Agilicoccus flavus TaxID=2775968 RepID=UPI001CF622D5|nr:hypothetical protein [Agilicoccus flavus]
MALGDFLARLGGRPEGETGGEAPAGPPSGDDLLAALTSTEDLVRGGAVPSVVTARVERVTNTVRDAVPRLESLGAGSAAAYSVMATATDYLPEAVGGYLRLPRRFADTRPVERGKTSLMVLVDQLDLLGSTMDQVFDAVCRDDAFALVAHGRFLAEKFGTSASGGSLRIGDGETPLPDQDPAEGAGSAEAPGAAGSAPAGPEPLTPPPGSAP